MNTIVVTLLPVGQGAMNLIEIYDGIPDDFHLIHLSLIDCGTDKKPENIDKSVDYVVAKMNNRHNSSTDGLYLDYVLFTHRDRDHWSLFNTILQKTFGTTNISNSTTTVRTFQREINTTVSENFFGLYHTDYFSYTRTFSEINRLEPLNAEYQRTFHGTAIVEESLHFCNTDQNYQVFFKINLERKKIICEIYEKNNRPVIMARLTECESNENLTVVIYSVFVNKSSVEKKLYLEIPYIEESLTLWKAWGLFADHLYQNELGAYDGLSCISDILKKGLSELSEDSFLYVSQQDILTALNKAKPVEPIVGQFLWGGNPSKDGPENKRTGVGILREKSEFLAVNGAIEVYPGDANCNHFKLLDNISLDILERIHWQDFKCKTVDGAASTENAAILNNGTSAVALLSVKGNNNLKFLFTGDATIHTFHSMYCSMKLLQAEGAVWTAPHHGSFTTLKGSFFPDKENPNKKTSCFPYFLSYSNPQSMVIESGLKNRHGLPNADFFNDVAEQFEKSNLKCKDHYVYANLRNYKPASWDMLYTPRPIYSGVSAEKKTDKTSTPDDPANLQDLTITYKIHHYEAKDTDKQYKHSEKNIATGGTFTTDESHRRRPGQPSLPPQELFLHRP